jgi:hypothetical protein
MTEIRVYKSLPQSVVLKDYVAGARIYKSLPQVVVLKEFTPSLVVFKSLPQVLIVADPSGDLRQDVLIDRPAYRGTNTEFIAPHVEFQGTEALEIFSAIDEEFSSITYTKDKEILYGTFSVGLGRTVIPTVDFNQYILYKGTINRILLESLKYTLPTRVAPIYPSARYWRILEVAHLDSSYTGMATLYFNGTWPTGGTISASSIASGTYAATNVLDVSTGSFWVTNLGLDDGAWIKYDFGVETAVESIAIQAPNSTTRAGYVPTVFNLQSSSDDSNWTTVKQFSTSAWSTNAFRTFNLDPL